MPISIAIRPLSTRFWAGEEIVVELSIQNTGTSIEEVPDGAYLANKTPIYRLKGPAYPSGVTFHLSGIVENVREADAAIAIPLQVYPGGTRSLAVPVSTLLPIGQPGVYEISAVVAGVLSPTAQFELFQPLERKVALERGPGAAETAEVNAACLLRSPHGGVIVRRTYPQPDADEMLKPERSERIAEVGARCSAPVCASIPANILGRGWVLFFDGPKLYAAARGMAGTAELELAGKITAIVDSPVTLASGAVDVLVLTEDESISGQTTSDQTISLVRFFAPPEPVWPDPLPETDDEHEDDGADIDLIILPTPAPVILWTGTLAARPHSIVAAAAEQGAQRVVYMYEIAGGIVFRHLVLSGESAPPAEGSALIPDVATVAGSAVHIYEAANGATRVAALVRLRRPGTPSPLIALVELCFDRSGVVRLGEETEVTELCEVIAEPQYVAMDSYRGESFTRLDWIIGLANGKVLRGSGRNAAREIKVFPLSPVRLSSLAHVALLPVAPGPAGFDLQPT